MEITYLLYTNGLEGWMIKFSMDAGALVLGQSLHAGPALHSFSYSLMKKSNVGEPAVADHRLLLGLDG